MNRLATVESIRVDQAIIVLKNIVFCPAGDSVHSRDSVEATQLDSAEDNEGDASLRRVYFRGPFLISLQSNSPVQITVDTIPTGGDDRIKFAIHRLRQKDVSWNAALPDSMVGLSGVVTGSVMDSSGTWTSFEFKTDLNQESVVRGNFNVRPGNTQVRYVLQFDLGSWFTDGSGNILDPNNLFDRWGIRWAIRTALGGHVRGCRDADDNGPRISRAG